MLQVFLGVASMCTLAFAAVVSERRRVEEKIRATSEQLREAMAELEAFSRSISHDLRSPIGAVMNFSTMLEEGFHTRLETEGLRMVHGIQASAESAVSLLDQLAQFAWAGREKGEKLRVDMTSLAQDAHAELVTGASAGDVHFEFRDLPPAWGSPALLRRPR